MADVMDQALGWDDELDGGAAGDFDPVEPGEYSFRVVSFERGWYNGGEKMSACNVAKVEIELTDAPRAARIFENLYLNRKVMWKIVSFFTAIGLHDKSDDAPFKPDWSRVVGRTGRCRVTVHEYNGRSYNDVDRWVAPDGPSAPKPHPQVGMAPGAF